MRKFARALDLYRWQLETFARAQATAREGHKMLAEAGRADMFELTGGEPSGRSRMAILRRDRPFARGASPALTKGGYARRRGAQGALPLLPIGMLSGRLRRNIYLEKTSGRGIQTYGVGSHVPYAQYILGQYGTEKMVARGVPRELRRRWTPRNKAFFDHYVKSLTS